MTEEPQKPQRPAPQMMDTYVRLLTRRRPFCQANYGDGEWQCILGDEGGNCNGENYTRDAQDWLIHTIVSRHLESFFYGSIHQRPDNHMRQRIFDWIHRPADKAVEQACRPRVDQWVDKDVLSSANVNGTLGPFIKVLRAGIFPIILVGPAHLEPLDLFPIEKRLIVPDHNAIQSPNLEATITNVKAVIDWYQHPVILFSAGMATNVVIWHVAHWARKRPPKAVTMIDCGALWDPYVGVFSRKHYKRPEWAAAREANISSATDSPPCAK